MIVFWIIAGVILLFGFVVAFGAPYVPSLRRELRGAFENLYPLNSSDVVVDLGSGDGVVLAEAARYGAKGIGYELNPMLLLISKMRLGNKAVIHAGDMWRVTIPDEATLVYAFIVTRDSRRLGKFIQQQADKQEKTIRVMTFGSGLKDYEPVKLLNAHSLYEITPNQPIHS